MKIIDAVWEEKNLGVSSCREIVFSREDRVEEIKSAFEEIKAEYLVAKVPAPRVDLLLMCQNAGYQFIETNIAIKKNLKHVELPQQFKRYESRITYREADDKGVEKILATVRDGIFDDDKVALDPKLGPQKSANRYYNWIENSLKKDSKALIVSLDNKDLGFVIAKLDGEDCEGTFIAKFPSAEFIGMGFALVYATFLYAKDHGCKQVHSGVSTNNFTSLRTNLFTGYEMSGITYCLIKHTH